MEDPEVIQIGAWVIKKYRAGTVWIERAEDGEGMEVSEEKVADCIGKFYEEHF